MLMLCLWAVVWSRSQRHVVDQLPDYPLVCLWFKGYQLLITIAVGSWCLTGRPAGLMAL